MDIATFTRLRRVDICMCVHPNHGQFPAEPFLDGSRRACDCANGDGVIAAQSQYQAAVLCVLVNLVGKLLGDNADCEWVFHIAVVWVGRGHEAGVVVDCVIVVESVAQVLFQLDKEAGGDEGGGRGVHAWFALLEME